MTIPEALQRMVNELCSAQTKNVTATLDGEIVRVKFLYHALTVQACGASGGRWNKENRSWDWNVFTIPSAIDSLKKFKTHLVDEMIEALDKVYASRANHRLKTEEKRKAMFSAIQRLPELSEKIFSGMVPGSPPLRPFQEVGVGFLEVAGWNGIIGDEMGLGKSPQALGFLAMHPELRPAVIISPNPAVCQWEQMIQRWLGVKAFRLDKTKDEIEGDIVLVPWSMVERHKNLILGHNPKAIIPDEGHYAKSVSAKRTKALFDICFHPSVEARAILTGTPMLNRPVELWPLLHIVSRGTFGGYNAYRTRYCGPKVMRFGPRTVTTYNGATNIDELSSRLVDFMIRRTKVEVAPEIPLKSRFIVPIEADSTTLSPEDRAKLKDAIEKREHKKMFEVMAILRRLCGMAKLKNAIDWAKDFLESSEEKLVIFAYHVDVQKGLIESLKEYGVTKFVAGQGIDERGKEQTAFMCNPDLKVAVCSISAARESLDLTAASNLAFVERDWVPGVELQAEDRIHRLTTTKPVSIYRLMSDHILDRAIAETVDKKVEIFRAVFEGIEGGSWTHESLMEEVGKKILDLL